MLHFIGLKEMLLIGASKPVTVRPLLLSRALFPHIVPTEFDLSHVEFSCLPSGLHLVERDVV